MSTPAASSSPPPAGGEIDALTAHAATLARELAAMTERERALPEALRCYRAAGIAFVDRDEVEERTAVISPLRSVHGRTHSGSSSAQSLQRATGAIETDYLNGEIVLLGRMHGVATPVNEALTRLARRMAADGLRPGGLGPRAIEDELAVAVARVAV